MLGSKANMLASALINVHLVIYLQLNKLALVKVSGYGHRRIFGSQEPMQICPC